MNQIKENENIPSGNPCVSGFEEKHRTLLFLGTLTVGALLSMCIKFFPSSEIAYVLCPWIYLPCFLYASREIRTKKDFFLWLLFWCTSFNVRYWGILSSFSTGASFFLTLAGAVVYAIPFMADRLVFNRKYRVLSVLIFPLFTVVIDYILELLTLGSLFSLAPTQFDNKPLIQLCSVLGSKGIVFVLTLTASYLIYSIKRKHVRQRIIIWAAAILLLHLLGWIRICVFTPKIEESDTINIGWSGDPILDDSFFSDSSDGTVDYNVYYLVKALEEAKEADISFLCFPEESFFVETDSLEAFIKEAQSLAKEYQMNLLLPVESCDYDAADGYYVISTNECYCINSEGEVLEDYLKSKLIPLAEEPYYVNGDSDLPSVHLTIDDKDINLSFAICFDGDFSSYIRTVPNNVGLFIDVSWDWDEVDDLHYRIIGMRAVENGFTVVKPTVCGYTTVTDYLGHIHSITHSDETGYEGVNVLELPLATCHTIYHRYGKYIDIFYVIGLFLLLASLFVRKANEMESTQVSEKKPLTRFGEFEFLKALAIIGLPMVHVMEEAMEANMASSGLTTFGYGIVGLCAFGPSVFMICMGFGIGGGRTNADAVRRTGIQFLLIGALLNIVRWLIPGIIQSLVLHTSFMSDFDLCLQSDIYYFAGIFFVFYSFMKQFKITSPQLLLISIVTLTINDMMTPIMQKYVTNEIASSLLGNFIYVNGESCFPLMSWMIFPTIGIIFGEILKKNNDEFREVFMRRMLDFSIVIFGAFAFSLWNYDIDLFKVLVSPANEYITDFPNVILLITLACFLIGITYYLCKIIGASKFMAFMLKISAFIIPFYLLQWVIIAWIFYATTIFHMTPGSFGIPAYLITVILITCLCIYVSSQHGMKIMKVLVKYTYIKKKKKKKVAKKNEK